MSHDPGAAMACRTCGIPLTTYVDGARGQVRYLHPLGVVVDPVGHDPDPAPVDEVDARHRCDFCNDERIAYTVRTTPISAVTETPRGPLVERYGTDWAACFVCAGQLRAGDLDGLQRQLRAAVPWLDPDAVASARVLQRAVLRSLLPGWTVAAVGRWPATPLPGAILPKVRDRLAALLDGPVSLPLGLDPPALRGPLADSVSVARLFWIDAEFTTLADHAAASLPVTALAAADLPAPHGLLVWAGPVGPRGDLAAATWSSGPDGLRIVGYRSIGGGLPPAEVQALRTQLGWLGPRFHVHLAPGDPVDAGSPAAVLAVTWLLVAQRLAETRPVEVDKAIRRAYQRAGRPVPDVQLVRIRGSHTNRRVNATAVGAPAGNRQDRPREFRWWVKAHWRQQAYGPGRALRRPVLVLPQLRGPDHQPIKASTVVRILTAAPPRPTPAPVDEPHR